MKDETIDKEIEHFLNLGKKAQKENLNEYDVKIMEKGVKAYLDALQSIDNNTLIKNHIKIMKTKGKLWEYEDLDIISTDLKYLILEALDEKDNFIKLAMEHGAFDEEDKKAANKYISSTKLIKDAINIFILEIKLIALSIQKRAELSPTIDRKIKGSKPKRKKSAELQAQEWAKDVWTKHPDTTQEQMAIDVKDALDLTQSIKTVIRWIKPFQPPKS